MTEKTKTKNDYSNPKALGAKFGNDVIPIQLGPCKISIVDYSHLYDGPEKDHKIVEGDILFTAIWRHGTFQVVIFNPKETDFVNILYLNGRQNCFKYWVTDIDELYQYLHNTEDYGEIFENDIQKEQLKEIIDIVSKYKVSAEC